MRYLNPFRWFRFCQRAFRLFQHDYSLWKLRAGEEQELVINLHLTRGCKRCYALFGHIYRAR